MQALYGHLTSNPSVVTLSRSTNLSMGREHASVEAVGICLFVVFLSQLHISICFVTQRWSVAVVDHATIDRINILQAPHNTVVVIIAKYYSS